MLHKLNNFNGQTHRPTNRRTDPRMTHPKQYSPQSPACPQSPGEGKNWRACMKNPKKRSILRKDSYSAVSFRIWIYDSDSSLAEWRSIADSSRWYFTLALITVTHCTARGASVTVTDSSCDLCLKPSRRVAVPPVHLSVCLSASVSPFFCPVLCFAVVLGGGVRGQVCRWLADHVETLSLYCKTGSSIVAH